MTMPVITSRLLAAFRALRHTEYRRLWIGSLLSNIGTFMQIVAQGWLVLQLTNSPFMLGLVGFAAAAPLTLLTPIGGAVADHFNRRRIMLAAQSTMTACAIILAVMIWTHTISIAALITLSVLSGTAVAFSAPSFQAMLLELVGREDLPQAIALNSLAFNTSRLIGPVIGAATLALWGTGWCYFLNGLSFLCVIYGLLRLRSQPPKFPAMTPTPLVENLLFGISYAAQRPTIKTLLLLTCAYGLFCFPQVSLLPVFARDVLDIGATGLGWLLSCFGAGGVLSALALAMLGDVPWRGRLYLAGAAGLGLMLICLGLSHIPALTMLLMVLIGVGHVQTMVNNNTMLQRLMPDELRGRLLGLHLLAFQGAVPFGNLLAGTLAEHFGAPRAVIILGAAFIACVTVAAIRRPKLRAATLAED